VNGTWSAV
jgi:hypothetical protein